MKALSGDLLSRMLVSPEFNVTLFAFLLNYPWEFLQVPFFENMPEMAHWEAVVFCTRATLGDMLIALVAYWLVALVLWNRAWIRQPGTSAMVGFVVVGVLITIGLEWHATEIQGRWQYSELMPRLPLLGTGLAPMLQWILLPPLVVWLARRQILGHERLSDTSARTAK
ncbi:MAG: hypothetical protein ACNA7W_18135 [Pseudomonadales bacterium]